MFTIRTCYIGSVFSCLFLFVQPALAQWKVLGTSSGNYSYAASPSANGAAEVSWHANSTYIMVCVTHMARINGKPLNGECRQLNVNNVDQATTRVSGTDVVYSANNQLEVHSFLNIHWPAVAGKGHRTCGAIVRGQYIIAFDCSPEWKSDGPDARKISDGSPVIPE